MSTWRLCRRASPCDDQEVLTSIRQRPQERQDVAGPARGRSASSGRTLVLVTVFLAIALMLALPIRSWLSQQDSLTELRMDNEAAQNRVDSLAAQREQWLDPIFLAEQARLRLSMVRPGEAGLQVLASDSESKNPEVSDVPDTWWGELWGSVDEASGRRAVELGESTGELRPNAPR